MEDLLKDSNISSLLKKFLEIGVTADVLWDVTDDILHNGGFTEMEIIRYNNARKAKEEQAIKGKGKFKIPYIFLQTISKYLIVSGIFI